MSVIKRFLILALVGTVAVACESDYAIWIPRTRSADALYRFIKNGKAGYIDRSGRVVVRPTLELHGNYGSEFHDGLLEIAVSDGVYVGRTGKVVLREGLYRGWDFSEGLAAAMRKGEDRWGYIDTSGKFAISPRFERSPGSYVYPFSDGLALIKVNEKFGYIDHSGSFVITPQFLSATSFSNGMGRVITQGPCFYFPDGPCGAANLTYVGGKDRNSPACKFTFIDKKGRVITEARFDSARDFSEGLAPVRVGALWGFIDKTGKLAITPRFQDANPFSSGLSLVREHDLYGYADKTGTLALPPRWHSADDFSGSLAVVGELSGPFWYINTRGDKAFAGTFAIASSFFKGLADVKLLRGDARQAKATFSYIDTSGRRIFTY